jgi:hypothetical protein
MPVCLKTNVGVSPSQTILVPINICSNQSLFNLILCSKQLLFQSIIVPNQCVTHRQFLFHTIPCVLLCRIPHITTQVLSEPPSAHISSHTLSQIATQTHHAPHRFTSAVPRIITCHGHRSMTSVMPQANAFTYHHNIPSSQVLRHAPSTRLF